MICLLIDLTRGVGTNTSIRLPELVIKYTNEEASEREQLPNDTYGFDGISDNSADTSLYVAGRH